MYIERLLKISYIYLCNFNVTVASFFKFCVKCGDIYLWYVLLFMMDFKMLDFALLPNGAILYTLKNE